MPAASPTFSPTLSAITAGFRGSSSGMAASILPTRSAPTSAALVEMPPPRRGEGEGRQARRPGPTGGPRGDPPPGRLAPPGVSPPRHVHADEPRRAGEGPSDGEAEGGTP